MLKLLLPVDGSPSALNATRKLIDTLSWYREAPAIELCAVHLPLPRVGNTGAFVSKEMVQKYYDEESDAKQSGSDMIYMGTRGMSALANMAMGSVTTRVLHLVHIPVVLIH